MKILKIHCKQIGYQWFISVVIGLLYCNFEVNAQNYNSKYIPANIDTNQKPTTIWAKKLVWGATFNNCITSFVSDDASTLVQATFAKPGLGTDVHLDYYLSKRIAISVGVRYQMRGTGLLTPDYVSQAQETGNPDSTHRGRIKMNTLEIPLALVYRGTKNVVNIANGTRFTARIGVSPLYNAMTNNVFYSIEDGFHLIERVDERYYRFDMPINISAGIDMNAAEKTIFHFGFLAHFGLTNVYNTNYYPNANARGRLVGFKVGWLF